MDPRAVPGRRSARWSVLGAALLVAAGALAWFETAGAATRRAGLFTWFGVDFGHYWAQSRALQADPPGAIYDLATLESHRLRLLRAHAPRAHRPRHADLSPTPYPPILAWLFTPFTRAAPARGFLAWSLLNLLAALHLCRRAMAPFDPDRRPWVAAVILLAYPVSLALFLGQNQLLLACALGESFLALRERRDLAGGVWLGCLIVKPQYGLLLCLVLLWKRRWRALGGAVLSSGGILFGSLVVAGWSTLCRYPSAALAMEDWQPGQVPLMVSWRSFVYLLEPGIGPATAQGLALLLGAASIVLALSCWRGAIDPRRPGFATRLVLLLVAGLLANPHGYAYGLAMLVVPAAWMLAEEQTPATTRLWVVALALVPSMSFLLASRHPDGNVLEGIAVAARASLILLVPLFVSLLVQAWRGRGAARLDREAMPAPIRPV